MKKRRLLFLMLLFCAALLLFAGCHKKEEGTPQQVDHASAPTIVYDQEIVSDVYLKERVSDATAIYYKSAASGEYGDENYLFERTVLPKEYTELEYIESTGTQSIDTGVAYAESLTFDLKFSDYTPTAGDGGIFGTEGWMFTLAQVSGTRLVWRGGQSKSFLYNSFSPYKTYFVRCGTGFLTVNGAEMIAISDDTKVFGYKNITLFKTSSGYSGLKLYYFKIYDGETLVRNYIPCYRNYDKAVGLYDLIGKRFYGNYTGPSTEPEYESEVVELPLGYYQLEYIESTGAQKINTDLTPRANYTIESTFAITNTAVNSSIWCARDAADVRSLTAFCLNTKELRCDYGAERKEQIAGVLVAGDIYTLKMAGGTWYLDEMTIAENPTESYEAGSPLQLFAHHHDGMDNNLTYGYLRLYAFKVYDENDVLLMQLVPCAKVTQKVEVGLYDVVNDVFYQNSGKDAAFVVGSLVGSGKAFSLPGSGQPTATQTADDWNAGVLLPNGFRQVEYVEGTGTQYFDPQVIVDREDSLLYECKMKFSSAAQYWNGTNCYLQHCYNYFMTTEVVDFRIIYENTTERIYVGNYQLYQQDWSAYDKHNCKVCILAMGDNDNTLYTRTGAQPGRIYGVKLTRNGDVVLNCVPCVRESDGEAGLYDLVSKKFVGNAGTGEVSCGEEVYNVPSQYEVVDYIEYTGTQSLSVPYLAKAETLAEVTLSFALEGDNSFPILAMGEDVLLQMAANQPVFTAYEATVKAARSNTSTKYAFTLSFDAEKALSVNDSVLSAKSLTIGAAGESLTLFGNAERINGTVKIMRVRIFEEGALVLDLIPCRAKYDGKTGFYESVGGVFYPSSTQPFVCNVSFEEEKIKNLYETIDYVFLNEDHALELEYSDATEFVFDVQFDAERSQGTFGFIKSPDLNWSVGGGSYAFGAEEESPLGARDVITDTYDATSVSRSINGQLVMTRSVAEQSYGVYRLGNVANENNANAAIKVFGGKVIQAGQTVADLVPVVRRSDQSIGFLDKTTNEFFVVYNKKSDFSKGSVLGHRFDQTRVITEASEKQQGDLAYVCGICGVEMHEHIAPFAYMMNFSYGAGVKEIIVYKGYDLSEYEVSDVAYSRNKFTNNYSRVNGEVCFAVVLEDGFEIEKIYAENGTCAQEGEHYVLSGISVDSTVHVLAQKKSVQLGEA